MQVSRFAMGIIGCGVVLGVAGGLAVPTDIADRAEEPWRGVLQEQAEALAQLKASEKARFARLMGRKPKPGEEAEADSTDDPLAWLPDEAPYALPVPAYSTVPVPKAEYEPLGLAEIRTSKPRQLPEARTAEPRATEPQDHMAVFQTADPKPVPPPAASDTATGEGNN